MTLAFARLQKEVKILQVDPPDGAFIDPVDDKLTEFSAQIRGPVDTVYEGGVFKLSINIPTRYPMEPPKVRFTTPVYHPNIDPEGRICLDILNPPPKGAWKPSLNLRTVIASIGLLLSDPNPDDGLVTDITHEFKHQRDVFDFKAKEWTKRHAMQLAAAAAGGDDDEVGTSGTAARDSNTADAKTNRLPVDKVESADNDRKENIRSSSKVEKKDNVHQIDEPVTKKSKLTLHLHKNTL